MTGFVALQSLLFAGECFFGASLIVAMAGFAVRRGPAAQKHLVWLCAFAAMLVLPLAAALMPPALVVHLPVEPAPTIVPVVPEAVAAIPAVPRFGVIDAVRVLQFVWLAGLLAIAAKMLIGVAGLMLLKRRSVPHRLQAIDGVNFADGCGQLRLRIAPGDEGPLTWGIFKPVVLLPKSSARWPQARLVAVLQHEFAHVRRHDSLCRLVALIACAFYWPNPFVWAAARRLRCEAEIAADDAVLASGIRASAYAEELVGLAREFGHAQCPYAGVSLSMAERTTLKERVLAVLSPSTLRSGVTKMDVLKMAAFGVAITAGLALARPCLAQTDDNFLPMPEPREHVAKPAPAAPAAPNAPAAVAVPPAPPSPAAVPAPPALSAVRAPHLSKHVVRITKTGEPDRVIEWEGDKRPAMDAETEKALAEVDKYSGHAVVVSDADLQKAMADAHRALASVRIVVPKIDVQMAAAGTAMSRAKLAEIQAARVKALEQSRDVIDRELAEARKAEAVARREAAEKQEKK